jgi:hypothetical protein
LNLLFLLLNFRYSYLLNMPLWSLTLEKVEELKAELAAKEALLTELKATTPQALWMRDLDALEVRERLYERCENARVVDSVGSHG